MARIAGIDLPKDKRIEIGLTYIYGIGRKSAQEILAQTGVNPDTRVKDLTDADEAKLREAIDHSYIVEGARSRSAQQDQRAYPQGPQEDHCEQEEVRRENRIWQQTMLKPVRRLSAVAAKRRTSNVVRFIFVPPSTTPWSR